MDYRECWPEISDDEWLTMTPEQYVEHVIHHAQHMRWKQGNLEGFAPTLHLLSEAGENMVALLVVGNADAFHEGAQQVYNHLIGSGTRIKAAVAIVDIVLGRKGHDPVDELLNLPEDQRSEALIVGAQYGDERRFFCYEKKMDANDEIEFTLLDDDQYPSDMRDELLPIFDPNAGPTPPTSLYKRVISDVL